MRYEQPTRLDGVGALLVAVLVTVTTGVPGLIAGTAVLIAWYTVPTLYTFAFGHLVVGALAENIATPYLVVLELGLLAILVGPALTLAASRWRAIVTSVVAIVFGGGVLALARGNGHLWSALGVVGLIFAIGSYGLHRYEHVALGLSENTYE
ncbi:hypothetical protein [Halocatena pleomorpha]|uniref:DUF8163 domain-containing protein n=1 Tax=Halocatena pleomorpha TaxID=1785090 RepID=A0A3P3R954_9EURY|nr:hypothetical protein [Halocatena pleomorpha]RRJ29459.1 hypothetical protein EIK79_12525 [Halocatena pleomorpha]